MKIKTMMTYGVIHPDGRRIFALRPTASQAITQFLKTERNRAGGGFADWSEALSLGYVMGYFSVVPYYYSQHPDPDNADSWEPAEAMSPEA